MITKMVVGFVFDPEKEQVLLIEKNKPEWMAGKLNGVGGKVEEGETFPQAMSRELHEETGLTINEISWHPVCRMEGSDWVLEVFYALHPEVENADTMESEVVGLFPVDQLGGYKLMSNIQWMVHLCCDTRVHLPLTSPVTYDHSFQRG